MSNQPPVRVGLIGFGYAGRTFHQPLIAATSGLRLAAAASSQGEALRALDPDIRVYENPGSLIADPDLDLVVVASPNDTHAPLALAALAAGKHVVVDKPFALDLDEARVVCAAAERAGRILAVFHNRRWDTDFLSVQDAIADGLIGRVTHFESRIDRFRPQVRVRWREQDVPGGGLWYDLGPHLVDQALQLFGLPETVTAEIAALRPGAQTDDWALAVLRYPQTRVVLQASMLVAGGSARMVAHGERGSLRKALPDPQEAQLLAGVRPGDRGWGLDPDPLQVWDAQDAAAPRPAARGDQGAFYRQLAAAVRGEVANPVPPVQALAVMAVIEAAQRSAASAQAVAPALTVEERAAFAASRPA
jgi:predicted dehydrogenase